ncbi:MAG: PP2C family protein-serine/threonine phosphatase [Candidatus Brocadiia bacterium]
MGQRSSGGFSFEELNREIRNYLQQVADELSATRALKSIQSAEAQVQRITRTITRASLARAAEAGFEIHDGKVSEPSPSGKAEEAAEPGPLISAEEDEIQQARDIQTKLLPAEVPQLPGIDIGTFSRFCHEVGGDYYDFIQLPGGRCGMVIADVSGKGIPAAMVMVMFRSVLRMVAANDHPPADTLAHVNRLLARDLLRRMFVTALYAVVEPARRQITFVNAGHNPPVIWRPRLSGTRAINIKGPALGLLGAEAFESALREKTLALEHDDCLCLYTDGVTEAKNLLGEEFGPRALARVFRAKASGPAQETVQAIVDAVDAHQEGAPQHDDMTLICVRAE